MKEYVSEPLSPSKNSLESGERNLDVDEKDVKGVKEGGIGLVLFYLFAYVAFKFACAFHISAVEGWRQITRFSV